MQINTDLMPVLRRNPQALRLAQFACFTFALVVGDHRYVIRVDAGAAAVLAQHVTDAPLFTIAAADSVWQEFARPSPSSGYHDILAIVESGKGVIDGSDLLPFFRHLLLVKAVVAAFVRGDASW